MKFRPRYKATGTEVQHHIHSLYWSGRIDCSTCKRLVARFELELAAKRLAQWAWIQTPYFTEWWRGGTGPCIRIELTPYEFGLLKRTGRALEQLNWLQEDGK